MLTRPAKIPTRPAGPSDPWTTLGYHKWNWSNVIEWQKSPYRRNTWSYPSYPQAQSIPCVVFVASCCDVATKLLILRIPLAASESSFEQELWSTDSRVLAGYQITSLLLVLNLTIDMKLKLKNMFVSICEKYANKYISPFYYFNRQIRFK